MSGSAEWNLIVADLIELDHILAGVVAGMKAGGGLVGRTIDSLLRDDTPPRSSMKSAYAPQTIGSGVALALAMGLKQDPPPARMKPGLLGISSRLNP